MQEQVKRDGTAATASGGGAFDARWKGKFTKLMSDLKVPKDQQATALQQLAGMGTPDLQKVYDEMSKQQQAQTPAWNEEWDSKFRALDVPAPMLKQIRESKAPADVLQKQFQSLLDTKMKYHRQGGLKRLDDAKASSEEKWSVMSQGLRGKELDKAVEGIRSKHVPTWKRVASVAINFVPGAYLAQYAIGKDLLTGDKIDRTNPINIIGAAASGFTAFSAVRGAVQGMQGLEAANTAYKLKTIGEGSKDAIEAARLTSKFEQGLKIRDYFKAATPVVNRFGEAGRLSAVGRGYTQSMKLAASSAAIQKVDGASKVDATIRNTVLAKLKDGGSIDDALAAAGRTGKNKGTQIAAETVARDFNRYGFLQGGTGKTGGSANAKFNPFRRDAGISTTDNANVFALGRSTNLGSRGGLAQGLGAIRGSNQVRNTVGGADVAVANGLAKRGLLHDVNNVAPAGTPLNRVVTDADHARMATGFGIVDDTQRAATIAKSAEWSQRLELGTSRLQRMFQFGASNRAAQRTVQAVENGADRGHAILSRAAAIPGNSRMIVPGITVGAIAAPTYAAAMGTGRVPQDYWDYLKDKKSIDAANRKREQSADREAKELERLYQEQQRQAKAGTQGAAQQPAPTGAAAAQVVGTSATGGQLVFDPSRNQVVDVQNGDLYDPTSGAIVGNLAQSAATGLTDARAGAARAGATAPAGVSIDPQTGYYVDEATGLLADPATGDVYDPATGKVVGNVGAGSASGASTGTAPAAGTAPVAAAPPSPALAGSAQPLG